MNLEEDIFDIIMRLPLFRIFTPIYKRYKEVLLYLFFGGLTFAISVVTYILFEKCGLNELLANIFSWIIAVLFAYITNRNYVFRESNPEKKILLKQIRDFFSARVLTLILEEIIIYVFISRMHYNSLLIKVVAQVVVIILNYIFSKWYIFKR